MKLRIPYSVFSLLSFSIKFSIVQCTYYLCSLDMDIYDLINIGQKNLNSVYDFFLSNKINDRFLDQFHQIFDKVNYNFCFYIIIKFVIKTTFLLIWSPWLQYEWKRYNIYCGLQFLLSVDQFDWTLQTYSKKVSKYT